MVDHIVDASELRGRVDIRVGVGRRRRWSDEAKGRIVAESYAPGAAFDYPQFRHPLATAHSILIRRDNPLQMTLLPGGPSLALAR